MCISTEDAPRGRASTGSGLAIGRGDVARWRATQDSEKSKFGTKFPKFLAKTERLWKQRAAPNLLGAGFKRRTVGNVNSVWFCHLPRKVVSNQVSESRKV